MTPKHSVLLMDRRMLLYTHINTMGIRKENDSQDWHRGVRWEIGLGHKKEEILVLKGCWGSQYTGVIGSHCQSKVDRRHSKYCLSLLMYL